MHGESSDSADFIHGLTERWLSDKAAFESREVDDFCNQVGIQLTFPAEKASWAHGVKDMKMTASAIQIDQPSVTFMLAPAALNSTNCTKHYSSCTNGAVLYKMATACLILSPGQGSTRC